MTINNNNILNMNKQKQNKIICSPSLLKNKKIYYYLIQSVIILI